MKDLELKVDYKSSKVSKDYYCHRCNQSGVKLWRDYNIIASHHELLCILCVMITPIQNKVRFGNIVNFSQTLILNNKVPAIPCEHDDSYWCYTSVPTEGVEWWQKLPNIFKEK